MAKAKVGFRFELLVDLALAEQAMAEELYGKKIPLDALRQATPRRGVPGFLTVSEYGIVQKNVVGEGPIIHAPVAPHAADVIRGIIQVGYRVVAVYCGKARKESRYIGTWAKSSLNIPTQTGLGGLSILGTNSAGDITLDGRMWYLNFTGSRSSIDSHVIPVQGWQDVPARLNDIEQKLLEPKPEKTVSLDPQWANPWKRSGYRNF